MPKRPKSGTVNLYELLMEVNSNISAVRDSVQSLDKKVELNAQETKFGFKTLQEEDQRQNELLAEHHDRSVQLKRDNDLKEAQLRKEMAEKELVLKNEIATVGARVAVLEGPRKWLQDTWKIFLVGGIAAGVLIKLIELYRDLPK